MIRPLKMLLLAAALPAGCGAGERAEAPASSSPHAAILIYHHVATDTPKSTSVSPQTFDAHLRHFADNGYRVLPLADVLSAIEHRTALPEKALVITFDDAYESIYTRALPRLERRGWPFTVFVTTDPIDRKFGSHLSWEQLRDIERRGGTIGNHSKTHGHFVRRRAGESEADWRRRITDEIVLAQARLDAELDHPLRVLAYPYGEFDADVEAIARDLGYLALGQQSGPAGPGDLQRIPRFPVATGFDDLPSLTEKLNSLPLPVTVLRPDSRMLAPDAGPPTLRIRLGTAEFALDRLTCFVSGQGTVPVRWLDRDGRTLEVAAQRPLPAGRSKYTCTAPAAGRAGAFFWYSHLWIKPHRDGSWYDG